VGIFTLESSLNFIGSGYPNWGSECKVHADEGAGLLDGGCAMRIFSYQSWEGCGRQGMSNAGGVILDVR
jgi:hypothetical protein